MALLHILQDVFAGGGFSQLVVAHVNYGLRGQDSEADAQLVRDYCHSHKIPFELLKVKESPKTSGIQAWARQIRQEFFQRCLNPGDLLFLGHHKGDLAESMLMRMSRGAGGAHLLGMYGWRDHVVRPLLPYSRKEIEGYLARHDLPICHDSSNDKLLYSRNRIRHEILPVLEDIYPGAESRMVALGEEIREITSWARSQLRKQHDFKKGLPASWLRQLPKAIAFEALATYIKEGAGGDLQLSRSLLEQIVSDINAGKKTATWQVEGAKSLCLDKDAVKWRPLSASPRSLQHRKNLQKEVFKGALLAGSKVSIPFTKPLIVTNHSTSSVELFLTSSHENIMVSHVNQAKEVSMSVLKKGILVYVDNLLEGVFDGKRLLSPHGEQLGVEQCPVSIQTHKVLSDCHSEGLNEGFLH